MTFNSYISASGTINTNNIDKTYVAGDQKLNARILFEHIFSADKTLEQKNKIVFLFINAMLNNKDFVTIEQLVNDEAIFELHPSLLKSMLIMVEGLGDNISLNKLNLAFKKQCEAYKK